VVRRRTVTKRLPRVRLVATMQVFDVRGVVGARCHACRRKAVAVVIVSVSGETTYTPVCMNRHHIEGCVPVGAGAPKVTAAPRGEQW
jgi:DTW domain-containing protein YfiP